MKFAIFKSLLLSLMMVANIHWAYAVDQGIIPNGKATFLDQNGKPLTSGTVDFYIPGTTTRKTTYQDIGGTTQNTNPVTLDAAGRALLWGTGNYRQIVKDRIGNLIWDVTTSVASGGGGGGGGTATGDGDLVGTIKPWAGMTAPNQYMFTYAQEVSRSTYSALFTTITSRQNIFCNSGSAVLSGLTDTTNFWIGTPVEVSCVPGGFSTISSKTSSTITLVATANITVNTNATFFPWGRGNGSTTFNIPDFRGLIPTGNNNMGGSPTSRLTISYFAQDPNSTGGGGGNQFNTLQATNLPPQTPSGTINVVNGDITISPIGGTFLPTGTGNAIANSSPGGAFGTSGSLLASQAPSSATFTGIPFAGQNAVPFGILPPMRTTNFIIKVTPDSNSATASGVTSLGNMTGDIACGAGLLCTGNTVSVSGSTLNPLPNGLVPTITLEQFGGGIGITDNTAAFNAAVASVGSGWPRAVIRFGTGGTYNFAGPLSSMTRNITLECAPTATVLQYNPTTNGSFLTWQPPANFFERLGGGGVKNCTVYSPDTTFSKQMINSVDGSGFTLEDVTIIGAGPNSIVTGGSNSVGVWTHGREFFTLKGHNTFAADIPMRLSKNPNSWLSADFFKIDAPILIGGTSQPLILLDAGVMWSNMDIHNMSGNLGTNGIQWSDNSVANHVSQVITPGSGYIAGDIITVAGGTCSSAVTVLVTGQTGGGMVTGAVQNPGICSVNPTNPVSQASTTGSGIGATFNLANVTSGPVVISGRAEQGVLNTAYNIYLATTNSRLDNVNISNFSLDGGRKGILLHNVKAATIINNNYVPFGGATEALNLDSTNGTVWISGNEFFCPATFVNGLAVNYQTSNALDMCLPTQGFYSSSGAVGTTFGTLQAVGIIQSGSTSGFATIGAQAIAGTPTIKWPTVSGTLAANATSPIILDATTGNISCPSCGAGSVTGTPPITVTGSNITFAPTGTSLGVLYNNAGALGNTAAGTNGQVFLGVTAGAPNWGTISGDATISNSGALTLATVNGNVGGFGSATQCIAFTVNAKGLTTAASQTTCTPAIANITGLGAGIATWAATPSSANLRAAITDETGTGLLYFQNGAIGTPTSGDATNIVNLNATQLTTGTIPPARTNGHQNGTATNDDAVSGEIGQYLRSTATNTGNAVTISNASPAVITETAHGLTAADNNCSIVNFTTTGSLPTGLAVGTNYYATITGINTYQVSISINNCLSATYVNTSSAGSGTHGASHSGILTTATALDIAGINLTAGDWDVTCEVSYGPAATTNMTALVANMTTTANTLDTIPGRLSSFQFGASGLITGGGGFSVSCPTSRYSINSTTTVRVDALSNFTVSTLNAFGIIRARRVR